ncbi:MAG: phage minor capsid protein, partial [Oscillospiraceae bacterium]|nr:phage minor capsid protein [Oscillospiraceae bacterium]
NKTAGDMQLDLASEMGCDLVEVTSHLGARPSHAEWQGQVYSISGKNPKYKPFSVTGYGTGDGLCGWNCRHSFYPYFEGLSERASIPKFTAEENLEMYENQQQQRAYERAIRKSKRELAGIDSARQNTDDPALKAKLDKEFSQKSVTLKKREDRLKTWCAEKDLAMDNSRVRTYGFGKSVSQKAVIAGNKEFRESLKKIGVENPPKTLAIYFNMRYNNTPEYQLLNCYMDSVKIGILSPLAGFELYKEYHQRIESEIIGIKTVNGIEIKSQSKHFLERVFGTKNDPTHGNFSRSGVDIDDIKDALLHGKIKEPKKESESKKAKKPDSIVFFNDKCAVAVNPITGNLIQTNPL